MYEGSTQKITRSTSGVSLERKDSENQVQLENDLF